LFSKTKWWNRNELKPFGPKKLVIRNYDFFYALFITMEEMRKIIEIEHESLDYISNFFDNFDYNKFKTKILEFNNHTKKFKFIIKKPIILKKMLLIIIYIQRL
jgi:hypothetical protein